MSEYDPLIRRAPGSGSDDLERARALFEGASHAYLESPVPWLVWAIALPGAALATPRAEAGGAPREVDVLRRITRGDNNKEIARRLGIGEASVKDYVNRIFSKLGVSDRTRAVAVALRRGFVHLDEKE
jgi:DNA-binding NarL/FixJ family response regulator